MFACCVCVCVWLMTSRRACVGMGRLGDNIRMFLFDQIVCTHEILCNFVSTNWHNRHYESSLSSSKRFGHGKLFSIFLSKQHHFTIRLYFNSVCCHLNPFDTSSCSLLRLYHTRDRIGSSFLTKRLGVDCGLMCVFRMCVWRLCWVVSSAADHVTAYVHLAIPNEYELRDAQCALAHTHTHQRAASEWTRCGLF